MMDESQVVETAVSVASALDDSSGRVATVSGERRGEGMATAACFGVLVNSTWV